MHNVANNAYTTLAAQIVIGAVSMSVAADNFPAAPFYLTLANSLGGTSLGVVEVTAKSGTSFTIKASPATFAAGSSVELRVMAEHLIELQDAAAVVSPKGDYTLDTKNLREANLSGKRVILKAGTFFIEGDGTEIIKKTTPEIWQGAGMAATFLQIRSTVPTTRDVFRIVPSQLDAIGYKNRGFQLCDFAIVPENSSGRYARHAINLDQTDGAAWFTSQFHFHHLHIDYVGGNSIYCNNGGMLDGYFCGKVSDNLLWSGVKMVGAGDSIQILQNTIAGENVGIDMSVRAGANVIKIADNNITARGGAMKLTGLRFRIIDNNVEIFSNGGTAPGTEPAAIIDILGSNEGDGKERLCRIEGNTVYNILGTSTAACRLNNCVSTKITNNRFHGGSAGQDLIIGSGCSGTVIYPDNEFTNNRKTDSGTGTVYVS